MPWWVWIVVSLAVLLAFTALGYAAIRRSARGRRLLTLSRRGKVRFARTLLTDPALSPFLRVLLAASLVYLAFPIDLVPDFLPVVGHADDLLLLLLAALLLVLFAPREAFERALAAGEAYDARRSQQKTGRSAIPR